MMVYAQHKMAAVPPDENFLAFKIQLAMSGASVARCSRQADEGLILFFSNILCFNGN